ncbi:hypothetical protein C2S52_017438 [Perilla frutescens var. hirtella]|nr:hypothetical protein C2S52_017438 [Perilla frutescens var. hirtella]
MNKVKGVSETLLICFYISGLKPHIHRELQLNRPTTLEETFELARVFKEKYQDSYAEGRLISRTSNRANGIVTQNNTLGAGGSESRGARGVSMGQNLKATNTLPVRRLTPAQIREKREKGECFNCDQKWSVSHRCPNRSLMILVMEEGEDTLDEEDGQNDEGNEDENIIIKDISSLNSMFGKMAPRSLRLKGRMGKQVFQVLINNGSNHNFIKPELVERLQLSVDSTPGFHVYIGNGDSLACQKMCRNVKMELEKITFPIDLFVLPIQDPDIILGVQWLQDLGRVTHDYEKTRMEFS